MMKPVSLLVVAVLAPALFCSAQYKAPSAPSTSAPAVGEAAKPAAPDVAKTDAPKSEMDNSYVIGTSDTIAVVVWKEESLSNKDTLVRPDGMISMPLLGDVMASGKTPLQLAEEIATKLKKYIQDPNVTVTLTAMNSKVVYLMGEVGKTGPLKLTSGMTVLEAIATAGGLTEYANAKKMYILRRAGDKQQKIPVQYKKALLGDLSLNLALNPGDTIVIP
jgi:polysaccharide export outer membrane protein